MANKNTTLAVNLAAIVAGMFMLAYASVPLYRLFCQVTGYNGTTQEAKHAPDHVINRDVTVRFNADISPGLLWEFRPGQKSLKVKVGQQAMTHFVARNLSDKPITGRAVYNVLPLTAGAYFVKIQCFCFTEQTLQPGAEVNMPVVFYIAPSIVNDHDMDGVQTITLSYTFFEVRK
jgi:cytochrome c oxidase assembly protein subunit 11